MKSQYTITQFGNYSSLEEVVDHLMEKLRAENKHVYHQVHRLGPRGGFPVHRHLTTNEWTIIYDAEFDFVTRRGKKNELQSIASLKKATVIYIPIGTCHTIRSKGSNLKYVVLKDAPDDFHLC